VLLAMGLAWAAPSWGQNAAVSLGLPLLGYYRAGRYMAVELPLSGDAPGAAQTLQTDDPLAVPTRVDLAFFSQTRQRLTVVLMVSDHATHLNQIPLHALLPDQRLVGLLASAVDAAAVQPVFPAMAIIPLRIDPGLLQPDIAPALESLDALVMGDWPKDVARQQALQVLHERGVTLVVSTSAKVVPDNLPWQQQGPLWVCRPARSLPSIICPAAYEPALGWNPGRPSRFRLRVVIIGIIGTLLLGLISLIGRRRMPAMVVLLTTALAIGVSCWNRAQPVTTWASGMVSLDETAATSTQDAWHYCTVAVPGDIHLGSGFAHPVFYDEAQLVAARPQYRTGPAGTQGLYLHAAPGFPLAALTTPSDQIFTRSSGPGPVPIAKLVAPAIYPGWQIELQQASLLGGDDDFGAICLRRSPL